ncbi:g7785 [Coccomyxa viridis]|uniref:G7785 protein n=1 Tax=Coccomyxa viridis TaxID=1274662 RepID=A0ABP1G374_9CHLO
MSYNKPLWLEFHKQHYYNKERGWFCGICWRNDQDPDKNKLEQRKSYYFVNCPYDDAQYQRSKDSSLRKLLQHLRHDHSKEDFVNSGAADEWVEEEVGKQKKRQRREGQAVEALLGLEVPEGCDLESLSDPRQAAELTVMRDRLYGVNMSMAGRPRGQSSREADQMDAFRDCRPKEYGERDPEGSAAKQQGLARLFEPPHDILFTGSFEEAKEAAQSQNRWLLVNVQSNSEFASHMLNRDVWREETVKDIIKFCFVLYQVQDSSEAGNKVKAFYRLTDLPVITVVQPITGAALRTWVGAIEPNRLLEELVPFMDHSIDDPAATNVHVTQRWGYPWSTVGRRRDL